MEMFRRLDKPQGAYVPRGYWARYKGEVFITVIQGADHIHCITVHWQETLECLVDMNRRCMSMGKNRNGFIVIMDVLVITKNIHRC